MNASELDPLVYTSWPDARTTDTKVPGRKIGLLDWQEDIPVADKKNWLNKTAVDDIFRWGSKYGRWPPAFQLVSLPIPGDERYGIILSHFCS